MTITEKELSTIVFAYSSYSVPKHIKVDTFGGLTIQVESRAAIEEMVVFFGQIHALMLTIRNTFQFRADPEGE